MKAAVATVTGAPQGALPAITVIQGDCLLYNSTVKASLGGGVMSGMDRTPEAGSGPPVIY